MKIILIFLLLLFFIPSGFSQGRIRKNTISTESGIYSRGILGLSYSRKFLISDEAIISADIFGGLGSGDNIYGLGINLNLGSKAARFVIGIDGKWCEVSWGQSFFFDAYYFSGLVYNPYIGLSVFANGGFTFKFRSGVLPIYRNHHYERFLPSCGVSFGYSF